MTPTFCAESALNSSVHAEGIKVDVENWLIMGSKEWNETPDDVKAWAYQAAIATGWTDEGLTAILRNKSPIYDDDYCQVLFGVLKGLVYEHPVDVDVTKDLSVKYEIKESASE